MATELSVILPVHNGGELLPRQLQALAGEHMAGRLEIVVVNNRSTDDSLAVAKGFAASTRNIVVLDAPQCRSRSEAVNFGVQHCSSRLIATVDHDDLVCPGWAEGMLRALCESELVGGAIALQEEPLSPDCDEQREFSTRLPTHAAYLPFAFGCSMGFSRELFESLGGFDPTIRHAEDVDFCWRAQEAGSRLAFAPDARLVKAQRGSPSARFRQHMAYGKSDVALAGKFDHFKMGSLLARTTKQVIWLFAMLPTLAVRPERRSDWAAVAGRIMGVAMASPASLRLRRSQSRDSPTTRHD